MVSYHDPYLPKLLTPHDTPSLNTIKIGSDLLCGQGFKRALDVNGDEFNSDGELESRDRTLSISSSMELHSAFDSIWNHNHEIVNEVMDFESSIMNEFEIIKSNMSINTVNQQPEIPCSDYLDIDEIAKDLLRDEEIDDSQMPYLSSCDINFEEFLLLENTVPWK